MTAEEGAASGEPRDKEQRANLLSFTKRILLLSSMSAPVLAAQQHQQQQWLSVGANPGEPSEVFRLNDHYWRQPVDVGEPAGAAESRRSLPTGARSVLATGSASSGQRSGLATRPLVLEQLGAAAARQQEQPKSAPATTTTLIRTKKQSAQLPERRPQLQATAASEESPNLTRPAVGRRESPTTPAPTTTTPDNTKESTLTAGGRLGAGSPTTNSSGGNNNEKRPADKESPAGGEVRHQRHSSQQQQLHQLVVDQANRMGSAELAGDGQIQAMAAAMLPLFWPSFQLANSAQQQQKSKSAPLGARLRQLQTPELNANEGWPVHYTQLSRQSALQNSTAINNEAGHFSNSPMAASDVAPTVISAGTDGPTGVDSLVTARAPVPATTPMPAATSATKSRRQNSATSTTTSERPARRRRRKPTYLEQQHQSAAAVTPAYPDSTRLASKYPMPKIKFYARNTDAPLANSKALERAQQKQLLQPQHQQPKRRPTDKGEAANVNLLSSLAPSKWKSASKQAQLPKSLSELIEQQVRHNATNLLIRHKGTLKQAYNPSSSSFALIGSVGRIKSNKAPTTSVSKVVRLLAQNTTAADLQLLMSQGVGAVREFYNDFKRHQAANSTSSPPSAPNASPSSTTTPPPAIINSTSTSTQSATRITTTVQPEASTVGQERDLREPSVGENVVTISVVSSVDSASSNASDQASQATTITPTTTTTTRPSQVATTMSILSGSLQQLATALALKAVQQDDNTVGVGNNKQETTTLQPMTTTLATTTTTAAAAKPKKLFSAGSPRFKGGPSMMGAHGGRSGRLAAKNIKLFHFKRKPDMAKLPFYKKPLNYTELGWTSEQIQEHLEYSGFQLDGSAIAAAAAGSQANSGGGNIDDRDAALLKRKRRGGKSNQFERLMAELHGQQQQQAAFLAKSESDPAEEQQASGSSSGEHASGTGGSSAAEEDRVPVIRKKVEPLVMKPMFYVMNQRRRIATTGGSASEQPAPSTASESGALAQSQSQAAGVLVDPPTQAAQSDNRSKPIIRMRRKHHGELPLLQFRRSDFVMNGPGGSDSSNGHQQSTIGASIHQPAPIWPTTVLRQPHLLDQSGEGNKNRRQQLLLVPSGMLTPSGSQLVPLYSPGAQVSSQRRLALAEFGGVSLDEQSRLVNELFAWRPARQSQLRLQLAGAHWRPTGRTEEEAAHIMKPSGGLAPSGEESFLLAPSAPAPSQSATVAQPNAERLVLVASSAQLPMAAAAVAMKQQQLQQPTLISPMAMQQMAVPSNHQPQQQQQHQPQQSGTGGELRVPKLLVKPMRPAKYSLNGYIPKPSLGQQPPAQQGISTSNSGPSASSMQTGGGQNSGRAKQQRTNMSQTASMMQHPHHFGVQNGPHLQTGRDLESSTSNEIFSRRRGLQQHQRNSAVGVNSAGQWSFSSLLAGGNQTSSGADQRRPDGEQPQAQRQQQQQRQLSAAQRQMEENKRKYIVQQQQLALNKSPTLSVHKANLIKAKLGLIVTTSTPSRVGASGNGKSEFNNIQQQASTNSVLTSEPATPLGKSGARILMSATSDVPLDSLVGAPLNSIPKTDFECTDSKGKFMAGLFADQKTGCQVWHLCANNRKYSFLCPAGTIFNAKLRICDWRYNVKCA